MAASSTFFSPALLSNNRTPPPCCSVRPSISSSPVLIATPSSSRLTFTVPEKRSLVVNSTVGEVSFREPETSGDRGNRIAETKVTECGVGVKKMMVRRKNSEGEEEEDDSPAAGEDADVEDDDDDDDSDGGAYVKSEEAAKYALIYSYKEPVSGSSAGNEGKGWCSCSCGFGWPIDVVVQPGNTGFFSHEEGEGDDDETEKTAVEVQRFLWFVYRNGQVMAKSIASSIGIDPVVEPAC